MANYYLFILYLYKKMCINEVFSLIGIIISLVMFLIFLYYSDIHILFYFYIFLYFTFLRIG